MKKIVGLILGFCSVQMVLAVPNSITISESEVAGTIQVKSGNYRYNVKEGGSINFGDSEKKTIGSWNGSIFTLSSNNKLDQLIKVKSIGIPVVFDSFRSSRCNVEAPLVGIFGDTQIDNFSVVSNKKEENLAEFLENNDVLLIVKGGFTTKFLDIYGSTEIDLGGTVNLQENGLLNLLGYGCNLEISGTLSSKGRLKVETMENSFAKVINSGNIASDTGEISIKAERFINNETGMIVGEKASFQVDTLIENYGFICFNEFGVTLPYDSATSEELGFNTLRLMQYGTFLVHNRTTLACNFESFGRTYINNLIFPYKSHLVGSRGDIIIDKVFGGLHLVKSDEKTSLYIGCLENGADFIESCGNDSKLKIGKLISDEEVKFAPKSGGEIIIGDAQVPSSFLYTEDGEFKNLGKLEGKSLALVTGTGKLNVSGAADLTLVAEDEAETQINQSVVKDAYLLGNEENTFTGATVEFLSNHGKLRAVNTKIKSAENDNEINFVGNTLTDKLYNNGVVTFEGERHHVGGYVGRSSDATIKVRSKRQITEEGDVDTVINLKKKDQVSDEVKKLLDFEKRVMLQTGSSLVTIDSISGTGDIDAFRQIYNKKLPTMFHTIGNVATILDYMPHPNEIPEHDGGDFLILANMNTDYINSSDINYGDALIFMQMNGHRWGNRYAKFIAGGLKVKDASSWGNIEGFIGLERLLSVKAGMIYNISSPIARDNGRWVDTGKIRSLGFGGFFNDERTRLVYYCPATYYSANRSTGIAVIDGDINLKSQTSILNQFSTIYTGGDFKAKTENLFVNRVGNILALGEGQSSIEAQNIKNECLPIAIRFGEATVSGSSGNCFNRETWYAHHETRELVTQSHGSTILVGGNLKTTGYTENIGSKLLSGGLFDGYVNSRSVLENVAMHGSMGTAIEGDYLNYKAPLLFVHVDSEKS